MPNDLISREALMQFPIRRDHYDRKNGSSNFVNGIETVLEYAQNLPAVDAVPVVHGWWINQDSTYTRYECSVCKARNYGGHERFCPNCGAKMDGDEDALV